MLLIGRDEELTEIRDRFVAGRRLVTIVGPGGIGKTALARAAIERAVPAVGRRAVVELARVERPGAVPGAVAAALGYSTFEVLLTAPPEQASVVLVDNCEHVLDGAADAVAELLEAWTDARVLATSRAPLGLVDESVVALEPLPIPPIGALEARTDAVLLFCERARDSGVEIDDGDLDLVVELCRRVDGMPLAIELAAARLRVLGVADLTRRVGEGVDLLARQRHRGDARHRSVHDTVVWSSRLLDDADRAAFARLGACAGPFDTATAAAVVGRRPNEVDDDVTDVLERLVDASLVFVERDRPRTRYRMLEPIRAVALDQLDQAGLVDETRERLAGHVHEDALAMLAEAVVRWDADLLPTLIGRFDQIDVALRHCLDHDDEPARAFLLYGLLWGIVHQARVDEVLVLGDAVLHRWPDRAAPHGADAVATYAMAMLLVGRTNDARALATDALQDVSGSALAATGLRRVLALAARTDGDHQRAAILLADAAGAAAEAGIVTFDLECRTYRAQDLALMGRQAEALEIVRRSAEAARRHGSLLNEVWARTVEASILAGLGEHGAAVEIAEATLLVSRAIAYPFGVICNLQTLAACRLATDDLAGAVESAEHLLGAVERSGSGDLRRALDVAIAVLGDRRHPAVPRLAATARSLPDTNPMTVHLPAVAALPDLAPLDRAGATRLARRALAEVRADHLSAEGDRDDAPTGRPARFVRTGDLWEVAFDGRTIHLAATKGMDDLVTLLARPGLEVHCADLAGAATVEAGTGEVLDVRARREYEQRIRDLQEDIGAAEADHDVVRAERAHAELDMLVEHLPKALGLAGRSRRQGGTAERARSAVTHRLRAAIGRIGEAHPTLGRHLATSITTGTYCCYQPVPPVSWSL